MPSISPARLLFVTCLSCFGLYSPAFAQIDRAEINGTITDTTGAVVPGAKVRLSQEDTGTTRQTISGDRGTFVLSSLPIGRFSLVISRAGFAALRIADIDLNSGVTRTINGQLQIETAQQVVQVEADQTSENLDKNDATFGGTIQSVQVARLTVERKKHRYAGAARSRCHRFRLRPAGKYPLRRPGDR